jgi:hypothetical protein
MRYCGHQFRMARAATSMSTREICELASMSMRTLANIEAAGEIEYGTKQAGRFAEETIAKLVELYEGRGVAFLPASRNGAGARYLPHF